MKAMTPEQRRLVLHPFDGPDQQTRWQRIKLIFRRYWHIAKLRLSRKPK
jgi:hypothetical protein